MRKIMGWRKPDYVDAFEDNLIFKCDYKLEKVWTALICRMCLELQESIYL